MKQEAYDMVERIMDTEMMGYDYLYPRGEEMRKRFDRDRAAAECGLCGREIWPEEGFYQVNGEIFCRDCLERYAEQFFAGFFREGTV